MRPKQQQPARHDDLFRARLDGLTEADLDAAYDPLLSSLRRTMAAEGFSADEVEIRRFADLRYFGQAHELVLPNGGAESRSDLAALAAAFGAEHERTYGHRAEDEAVECVALRLAGRVPPPELAYDPLSAVAAAGADGGTRTAYFGPDHGPIETPVLSHFELKGRERPGPLIVEEYDATAVVPPGWRAGLDANANIVITVEDGNTVEDGKAREGGGHESRSRDHEGDPERAGLDRRRDGAGHHAHRLFLDRARFHGLFDGALRRPGPGHRGWFDHGAAPGLVPRCPGPAHRGLWRRHAARRHVRLERSLRRWRHAPTRRLHRQAHLLRRLSRGLRRDAGAPDRRGRHRPPAAVPSSP